MMGNSVGDTAYIATNSFGQWMVRKPVYQYFIESPSVVVLNMMDTEVTDDQSSIVTDEQPKVVKNPININFELSGMQFVSSGLVLIAMLVVRRKLL